VAYRGLLVARAVTGRIWICLVYSSDSSRDQAGTEPF
jgi:hypothetical protein